MKRIDIVHKKFGLNNPQLVINAIVDIAESDRFIGTVEVSPDMRLSDVESMLQKSTVYQINSGFVREVNLKSGTVNELLQVFIK